MKLLIPYFVLSLVFIIPKYFLSRAGYISDEMSGGFMYIVTAIFSPRSNVWGHFWFIPTLFFLYLIGGGLTYIFKNSVVKVASVVVSLGFCLFPIKCEWLSVNDICKFMFYFVMGMTTVNFMQKYDSYIKKPLFVVAEFVLSAAVFYIGRTFIHNRYVISILDIITALLMILCVFGLSMNITRIFGTIGKYVFPIFIMGWPIQAVVEVVFNKVLKFNWYITTITMFVVGFLPILVVFVYKKTKLRCKFLDYVLGVS